MKNQRRMSLFVILSLLLVLGLVACGGSKAEEAAPAEEPKAEAAPTEEPKAEAAPAEDTEVAPPTDPAPKAADASDEEKKDDANG